MTKHDNEPGCAPIAHVAPQSTRQAIPDSPNSEMRGDPADLATLWHALGDAWICGECDTLNDARTEAGGGCWKCSEALDDRCYPAVMHLPVPGLSPPSPSPGGETRLREALGRIRDMSLDTKSPPTARAFGRALDQIRYVALAALATTPAPDEVGPDEVARLRAGHRALVEKLELLDEMAGLLEKCITVANVGFPVHFDSAEALRRWRKLRGEG